MASDNYKEPCLNSGYSDHSSLCGNIGESLIGGESMSGGNTTNYPSSSMPVAPGSQPVNLPLKSPASKMDAPELVVPSSDGDYSTSVKKGG